MYKEYLWLGNKRMNHRMKKMGQGLREQLDTLRSRKGMWRQEWSCSPAFWKHWHSKISFLVMTGTKGRDFFSHLELMKILLSWWAQIFQKQSSWHKSWHIMCTCVAYSLTSLLMYTLEWLPSQSITHFCYPKPLQLMPWPVDISSLCPLWDYRQYYCFPTSVNWLWWF